MRNDTASWLSGIVTGRHLGKPYQWDLVNTKKKNDKGETLYIFYITHQGIPIEQTDAMPLIGGIVGCDRDNLRKLILTLKVV